MTDLTKLKPKDLLTEEPDPGLWTVARWNEIERRLERLEQCEAELGRRKQRPIPDGQCQCTACSIARAAMDGK